jgi:hypothetical protein
MLAIILIIVAIVLGAIYWFMKQEEEEEPVVMEPVVVDTTPAGPEVDIADGIPIRIRNSQYRTNHGNVSWKRGTHVGDYQQTYIVPAGQAKTWADCQAAAKRLGHKSWIYNKTNKSCSAYVDNNYLMRMRDPNQVDPNQKTNFIVGCTDSGVTLGEGCENWVTGDRVRGVGGSARRVELEPKQQGISLDQCIQKGKSQGKDAIFYYTANHPDQRYTATCYEIVDSDNLVGFTGNPNDVHHIQACTDPSKKIINGCQ